MDDDYMTKEKKSNKLIGMANLLGIDNAGGNDGIYKVRLIKVRSTHNNIRTDFVEGETTALPVVGKAFLMFGKGLVIGTRCIHTTPVKSVEQIGNTYMFTTENSTYKLEVLDGLGTIEKNN